MKQISISLCTVYALNRTQVATHSFNSPSKPEEACMKFALRGVTLPTEIPVSQTLSRLCKMEAHLVYPSLIAQPSLPGALFSTL